MPTHSEALERIASAAQTALLADVNENAPDTGLRAALVTAITDALQRGHSLAEMTAAQERGESRARETASKEVLRQVRRIAKAAREADLAYDAAVRRAAKLKLSNRLIAAEASVAASTIRALLSREPGKAGEQEGGDGGDGEDLTSQAAPAPNGGGW